MMKHEFEALTMRGNAEIGGLMYESIEHFYMSDNAYHQTHGGRNETMSAPVIKCRKRPVKKCRF